MTSQNNHEKESSTKWKAIQKLMTNIISKLGKKTIFKNAGL